jgi:hypothetical protein
MTKKLIILIMELAGTATLMALSLPQDQRQLLKLQALRSTTRTTLAVAEQLQRIGLRAEAAYKREVGANG